MSNSSSTVYVITNKSDKAKELIDFVKENPQLVKEWNDEYGNNYSDDDFDFVCGSLMGYGTYYTQGALERSAINDAYDRSFEPNEEKMISFGDEDGTVIGQIFDYILRGGGESESFRWRFDHYNR